MKPRKDKGARERGFRERLDTAAHARHAMLERLRATRRHQNASADGQAAAEAEKAGEEATAGDPLRPNRKL